MSLDDLVSVSISASTATPSKAGFGTPLIAAQKVPAAFTSRVRLFSSLQEMLDFGFVVTDPAYLAAQKIKAQNPAPKQFKIGKRLNKTVQSIELTCLSAQAGDVYEATINGTKISYTVPSAGPPTTTTVATAIELLIEAIPGIDSVSSTNKITVTATGGAGTLYDVKGWTSNFELRDKSADPGLAADLAAIKAADNDWYGLALDSQSPAEIAVAALFVETEKKISLFNTSDIDCENSGSTTDIMYTLKQAAYARSGVLYSRSQLQSWSGLALMAKQFAGAKPGEDTWAYKTMATVLADTLQSAGRAAILAKNGNVYETVANINITQFGKSAAGEYFDVTRFIDWQTAEIQTRVFGRLANSQKIDFTDEGKDLVLAEVKGALALGVERKGLVKGSTTVVAPDVADVSDTDKGNRNYPDIEFGGRLRGAIHTIELRGRVTL